jgi:hypothetical protein
VPRTRKTADAGRARSGNENKNANRGTLYMTPLPEDDDGHWLSERRWIGYAGLLPFLIGVAALLTSDEPAWRAVAIDTLRHYAAVIASFLGAVHWGMAARHDPLSRARLRWGVMPALIAWVLLAVTPAGAAFFGFALLFVLILAVDRYLLPVLDDAYRELRLQLSVVVVAALLVAAVAA